MWIKVKLKHGDYWRPGDVLCGGGENLADQHLRVLTPKALFFKQYDRALAETDPLAKCGPVVVYEVFWVLRWVLDNETNEFGEVSP